jgi:hypothetical protein
VSSSSAEVQKLVRDTLIGNSEVMALANGVYDSIPANPFGSKTAYISFGPEDTVEDDAECITGIEVTLQIDVWSRAVGSVECKRLTDLVRKALHRKSLTLTDNALVDASVDVTRVFRDPDGVSTHGVVTATFRVEEPA